jgi:lipopolysaccharide export LptBFGC system permease protein LptF
MAETDSAPTEKAEVKAPANNKETKSKQKSSSPLKIVLIVLGAVFGVIALIFVLIVVIAVFATPASRKASDSFINNIQTKNSSAGYAELSSAAQTTVTQEQFKQVVEQIGPILSAKPVYVSSTVTKENGTEKAVIKYTIKGTDEITYNVTITLMKQDDTWKVEVFDSQKQ